MTQVVLNIEAFKAIYPAFANVGDAVIQNQWDILATYMPMSDEYDCESIPRQTLMYLLLAHSLYLLNQLETNGGSMVYPTTSASVDKVSVGSIPPPFRGMREYWLSLSPYGLEYMAIKKNYSIFLYAQRSQKNGWINKFY